MIPKDKNFAADVYAHAKALWTGSKIQSRRKKRESASSAPFTSGRDPKSIGEVLNVATEDMGWAVELEQARVIAGWAELVGPTVAPHTQVMELRDGVLLVQCDSTACATELRRMRATVLTRLLEEHPDALIQDLRFLAPGAPSWRHGSRVVKGRGPRDTYG